MQISKEVFQKTARTILESAHGEIIDLFGGTGDSPPGLEGDWEQAYDRLISLIYDQLTYFGEFELQPENTVESMTTATRKSLQDQGATCGRDDSIRPYVEKAIAVLKQRKEINLDGLYDGGDRHEIVNLACHFYWQDNPEY